MIAANLFYMSGGEKMKLKKMLPFVGVTLTSDTVLKAIENALE